jgi:primosomal protein N' (replication factor Y) (superfamily II helicase)
VRELRRLPIPQSTLGTLVRRKLVRVEEVDSEFFVGSVKPHGRLSSHEHLLNEPQTAALASIVVALEAAATADFKPLLLHGVTGSGKTAVYIAAMQRTLAMGKSALLLVPEIGLTPQMAGEMYAAFGDAVALLHSGLTPDERAGQWHRIRSGAARVVVGTRSAVFAPVVSPGLIIVDEEHDSSYKQEETPRYHGRDVAVMRAKLNGAVIVLGSATPSLESWSNATRGRYALIEIKDRVADRPLPEIELLDMRHEFQETGREEIFSRRLIETTQVALDRGEQVIILLNRRGYSFVVLCRSCGAKLECENCAIALTHHKAPSVDDDHAGVGQRLECHYCGYRRTVPKLCPKCNSEHLYYLGAGSQQGEERLQEIFPTARIGRMDRDTVRGRAGMERLLTRLHSGEINLLVGTQMIAKGHDIHGVTLVGVVGADNALSMPDFRAAERVFQLLTQVSGRAGRGELAGRVVVQTYYPEHYAIKFAAAHDYKGFAARELQFRQWMFYPPVTALANVIIHSEKLEEVVHWAGVIGRLLQASSRSIRVLGPAPAPLMRLKRSYRYHLVLKAASRKELGLALRRMLAGADSNNIPRRNIIVDVDAVHLM